MQGFSLISDLTRDFRFLQVGEITLSDFEFQVFDGFAEVRNGLVTFFNLDLQFFVGHCQLVDPGKKYQGHFLDSILISQTQANIF